MQLTVRDLAKALEINEKRVHRLISDQHLPAERVNGEYYFNRSLVLEWAMLQKIEIPPSFFHSGNGNGNGNGNGHGNIEEALRAGGIYHGITGTDKESVLRSVVHVMPFPENLDREFMLQVLLSREALGSTGVGDGLAIPHPRYPMVLPVPHPFITLCFLQQPIPYSTATAEPVHTLFALVCPSVRMHLVLLAQLATALRDPEFRRLILSRAQAEEILQVARRLPHPEVKSKDLVEAVL